MTSPPASPRTFDLLGPLPSGRTAIEASAGTGKTFALATLAVRFVAEADVPVSELLFVTFTRAAVAELRDRIRGRLVGAVTYLRGDETPVPDDPLGAHLAACHRSARLARLERAVAELDGASVLTIHGFATQVLPTLGLGSGVDPDLVPTGSAERLVRQVCADVLAMASVEGRSPEDLPGLGQLVDETLACARTPDMAVEPAFDEPGASMRTRLLAELVRRSLAAADLRQRSAGVRSFDMVLADLRDAVHGPAGLVVSDALRSRYRVAFVDEFQDTDPVQWDIFSTLFGGEGSGTTLVLVGDPKQAVYGFRGADIPTYLAAVADASGVERASLDTNWRSDAPLLAGLEALLDGVTFGDPAIAFRPVSACEAHQGARLATATGDPVVPVEVRLAMGGGLVTATKAGRPKVAVSEALGAVLADLVAVVGEHLAGSTISAGDAPSGSSRPVRPSDLAVLVTTASVAEQVRAALVASGIPAVAAGRSVLETDAADQWRYLLDGVAHPADEGRARAVALSWFLGWTADELDTRGDEDLVAVNESLRRWGEVLAQSGPAAFVHRVRSETAVAARVLALPDGRRKLADLDHVGELLAAVPSGSYAGPAGLLDGLSGDLAGVQADGDRGRPDARRSEGTEDAVQVLTVWAAKGLEFGIVCVPNLFQSATSRTLVDYHRSSDGARAHDVARGKEWPDRAGAAERRELMEREWVGESLRLLYVALTRAKHQVVVWWAPVQGAEQTGLARVLFGRVEGRVDPSCLVADPVSLPADAETARAVLAPVEQRASGLVRVEVIGSTSAARPVACSDDPVPEPTHTLAVATLERTPDRSRRRWSFSSLVAASATRGDPADPSVGERGAADEPDDDYSARDGQRGRSAEAPAPPAAAADPSPNRLADLPAGTAFGTLVHAVLEGADFAAADRRAALEAAARRELSRGATVPGGPVDLDTLVDALFAVLDAPLGPVLGHRRLADLVRSDRLDELSFELHLAAGGGARASLARIGALVATSVGGGEDHGLDAATTDALVEWGHRLAGRSDASTLLAGHLTGSIDVVVRLAGDGPPRFVVVDYKTNRLHDPDRPAGRHDYGREALAASMVAHDYPLQALLYTVALHRYLRWRLPDYDPATHLGGVAYLFLRGLVPDPADPDDPPGVFGWRIAPRLVEATSELLAGRGPDVADHDDGVPGAPR
ncbi:MAG: UvrD-helicase domain-containing protein [Acidimicrobiales bacterium]